MPLGLSPLGFHISHGGEHSSANHLDHPRSSSSRVRSDVLLLEIFGYVSNRSLLGSALDSIVHLRPSRLGHLGGSTVSLTTLRFSSHTSSVFLERSELDLDPWPMRIHVEQLCLFFLVILSYFMRRSKSSSFTFDPTLPSFQLIYLIPWLFSVSVA